MGRETDMEIEALYAIVAAFEPIGLKARRRVLMWAIDRLDADVLKAADACKAAVQPEKEPSNG